MQYILLLVFLFFTFSVLNGMKTRINRKLSNHQQCLSSASSKIKHSAHYGKITDLGYTKKHKYVF